MQVYIRILNNDTGGRGEPTKKIWIETHKRKEIGHNKLILFRVQINDYVFFLYYSRTFYNFVKLTNKVYIIYNEKDIYCTNFKLFRYSVILSPILFSLEMDLDILKGKFFKTWFFGHYWVCWVYDVHYLKCQDKMAHKYICLKRKSKHIIFTLSTVFVFHNITNQFGSRKPNNFMINDELHKMGVYYSTINKRGFDICCFKV